MWWRKAEQKVEVLQVAKHNGTCCFNERRTYGLPGRSFTQNSETKLHKQLFHVQGEHKIAKNDTKTTTFAFYVHLLCFKKFKNWREELRHLLICPNRADDSAPFTSKLSIWTVFYSLRICYSSLVCYMNWYWGWSQNCRAPMSVFISWNIVVEPFSLCISSPLQLFA